MQGSTEDASNEDNVAEDASDGTNENNDAANVGGNVDHRGARPSLAELHAIHPVLAMLSQTFGDDRALDDFIDRHATFITVLTTELDVRDLIHDHNRNPYSQANNDRWYEMGYLPLPPPHQHLWLGLADYAPVEFRFQYFQFNPSATYPDDHIRERTMCVGNCPQCFRVGHLGHPCTECGEEYLFTSFLYGPMQLHRVDPCRTANLIHQHRGLQSWLLLHQNSLERYDELDRFRHAGPLHFCDFILAFLRVRGSSPDNDDVLDIYQVFRSIFPVLQIEETVRLVQNETPLGRQFRHRAQAYNDRKFRVLFPHAGDDTLSDSS